MMFHDAKILGPYGEVAVKDLKPGDLVWSWNGNKHGWTGNRIVKVERGQSKTAYSIFSFDVALPMYLRCSTGQLFRIKGPKNIQSESVRPGQAVLASEGAHVFRAKVGAVLKETLSEPEDTFSVELLHEPRNILAGGFLCKA